MKKHNIVCQTKKWQFPPLILPFDIHLKHHCNTRRLGDFEGTWKVCSKVGAEGYLDACGVPEPMKSEMLAAVDVVEMKRLGGGKVG